MMVLDVDEGTETSGLIQGKYNIPGYEPGSQADRGDDVDASFWADAELVPCYTGDCTGASTALQGDSWGRIKASSR